MANQHLFSNNASTTLVSLSGTGGTSLVVASSSGFPAPGAGQDFICTMQRLADGLLEIVSVTNVTGTTWTVARAQEGTAGLVFAAGDKVELRPTAGGLLDMVQIGGSTADNTFQNPIAAPNAVGNTDLVNAQQMEQILSCSLRMAADQTSGTVVKYDTANSNPRSYWNSSTKFVNGPVAYGWVQAAVEVQNTSGGPLTVTFTLTVAGTPRAIQTLTIPNGAYAYPNLFWIGSLSGQVALESSQAFSGTFAVKGTASGGNATCTTFGMATFLR